MFDKKNQQGVLLLLALVMTSVILVAALVLATLAIREARLSTSSDRANTAYLGSEGAAEEVLYRINKEGLQDLSVLATNQNLGNGVQITRTITEEQNLFFYDFVPAGQVLVLNLYNTALGNQAAGISSLVLNASSGREIDYILSQWDGASLTEIETGTIGTEAEFAGLDPDMAYELVLAPIGISLIDLQIKVDGLVEVPTTVYVEGELDGGKQAVQLVLPKAPPWDGNIPSAAVCGNGGAPEPGEQCDDGNTQNGDGCSSTCQLEPICGNGPPAEAGEQCDDGNTTDGDGCSATCTIEAPQATTVTINSTNTPYLSPGNATVAYTLVPADGAQSYSGSMQLERIISPSSRETIIPEGANAFSDVTGNQSNSLSLPTNIPAGTYALGFIATTGALSSEYQFSLDYGPLSFSYNSRTFAGCPDSTVSVNLNDNSGDPSMTTGTYTFGWGPGGANTCNWLNYTTDSSMVYSVTELTGANDPTARFVFIGEEAGGCNGHSFRIYDRNTNTIRTGFIPNPCSTVNFTGYNPKWIADQVGTQLGW